MFLLSCMFKVTVRYSCRLVNHEIYCAGILKVSIHIL